MTDQQFQPGQPMPPTQGGGVFGGGGEDISPEISQLTPAIQPIVEEAETENKAIPFGGIPAEEESTPVASNPFEGYVIPQEISIEQPIEEIPVEPEVTIIEEPLKEETPTEENPVAEITIEESPIIEEEPEQKTRSDIQQKFTELTENISELTSLLSLKEGEVLEIIGANNDKISLLYQFGINDQDHIYVKRIETDKSDDETTFNELKLGVNSESNLLEIFVDDMLLFQEDDLLEDTKKKSQVMDKLNKFIFLTESKLKDVQKELRAKQEEEEERKRLQDIFRNF